MANVRIDQHGVPKGPVYEWTAPQAHRSGVCEVDATDPQGTAGAVSCAGYQCCRFDIEIAGSDFEGLEVEVLFWNSRRSTWSRGASARLSATGSHAMEVDVRGATVFLKVTEFSGTSFTLDADYSLS